jgi:2-phospho-L-lactate transferase/gluconeogenesis factor (CofD/UPF0052 family)
LRINVVLFSGGRGAASIASALINHEQIALTNIVNAYDDGLSTGRIRAFVPGMLGPSDIRKSISTLMHSQERSQRALRRLIEYRFPKGTTRAEALANLQALIDHTSPLPDATIAQAINQLTIAQVHRLARYVQEFLRYEAENFAKQIQFDYADCAVGNILFAGCYLWRMRDFNSAVDDMAELCECAATIMNVTNGQNYVLSALKDDSQFLADESSIVSPQNDIAIARIFLLDNYLTPGQLAQLNTLDIAGRIAQLSQWSRFPVPNPRVIAALTNADIIIYGPGTQHSSLFPSYLTNGIAEAIAANSKAEKIFVANITLDHDIGSETADSLVIKFHTCMNRYGATDIPLAKLMTRAFIQSTDETAAAAASEVNYVPFNPVSPKLSDSTVLARNWEAESGHHLGGLIVDELVVLLRRLRDDVQPYRHMLSIIVPALNEERTIERVLQALDEFDTSDLDVEKEIIVVDGQSSDRTYEIAKCQKNVRVYQTKAGVGRGTAIRLGFSKARGNVIVTFPADNEYSIADIRKVVQPILSNQFNMVIGSRAIKCVNLEGTLQYIYGRNWPLFIASKYGGMLLSILSLLIYNRYISDPLSSLKAYDRILIDNLDLRSDGVNLECEIIAKVSQHRDFILEVPVNYTPRTRAEGKKTTFKDGLAAIAALFTSRLKTTESRPKP